MKKYLFVSKQGLFIKFISILLQNLIVSPIVFLLSYLITIIIISFFDADSVFVLKIIFLLLNVLWIIRNSIIRLYDNKIILRSWIGTKQIVEIDNLSSLRIINYKGLRNMILNAKGTNPLIANCAAFFIPMGNFITFKNKFGRDVVIGVWNCKKLYELLKENASAVFESTVEDKDLHIPNKNNIYKSYKPAVRLFVKMPLMQHIIMFFKHFYETILLPLFISFFYGWLFNLAGVKVMNYVCVIFAFAISAFVYYKVIRVVVDTKESVIKLNLFSSNDRNVIKYNNISNLKFINSEKDIIELNKKSSFFISTPYFSKNVNELISFELPNDIGVVLSVNKPHELYDLINNNTGADY